MNHSYESDGARLGFSENGTGQTVIFLHPTPVDREYWRPLVQKLAGVRAIVPDMRGHGVSELGRDLPVGGLERVPDAPVLTVGRLATDIHALLNHLEIPQAVFVGCSIGGYVLLELWRRAPERMGGLAIVCSKPQADSEANLTRRAEIIMQARAEGVGGIFDTMVQSQIGATSRQKHPEIVAQMRARMTLSADALVAVQAGLAVRPDSVLTVTTISAPVLAIAGGEDASATPGEMEAFRAAPGGCEFHVLPDAGHFAAYEQPRKVAALLAAWLRQIKK